MAFVKASTFKRTVKFRRPGPDVDSMIDVSFVAEFAPISAPELKAMRDASNLQDADLARKVLRSVDGGDVTDVLDDSIAATAVAMAYFDALREGIAAKNSGK